MNKKLIELKEGRCGVIPNGNTADLNKVLQAAFPNCSPATGDSKVYLKGTFVNWRGSYSTQLPAYPISDFLTDDDSDPWDDETNGRKLIDKLKDETEFKWGDEVECNWGGMWRKSIYIGKKRDGTMIFEGPNGAILDFTNDRIRQIGITTLTTTEAKAIIAEKMGIDVNKIEII